MSNKLDIDIHSKDWIIIEKEVQERLVELKDRLSVYGTEPDTSNYIRGQIFMCKTILMLPVGDGPEVGKGSGVDYNN